MAGYYHPKIPRREPEYVNLPTFVGCICGKTWYENVIRDKNADVISNGPYKRYDYCDFCKDSKSSFIGALSEIQRD